MNLPADSNGWMWVSIEWLLKNVTYSYDFGSPDGYPSNLHFWSDMIESKALDAGFLRVVESLQTHGWMSPINVELGHYDDPDISLVDGHHRLVAAILLCMDMVPLWDWGLKGGRSRLRGCPDFFTHYDHHDEYSLLVEVL